MQETNSHNILFPQTPFPFFCLLYMKTAWKLHKIHLGYFYYLLFVLDSLSLSSE